MEFKRWAFFQTSLSLRQIPSARFGFFSRHFSLFSSNDSFGAAGGRHPKGILEAQEQVSALTDINAVKISQLRKQIRGVLLTAPTARALVRSKRPEPWNPARASQPRLQSSALDHER